MGISVTDAPIVPKEEETTSHEKVDHCRYLASWNANGLSRGSGRQHGREDNHPSEFASGLALQVGSVSRKLLQPSKLKQERSKVFRSNQVCFDCSYKVFETKG